MKKGIEIAFAIALFLLAIISTIWSSDIIENITYAVVVPSFILSIISFVAEISEFCKRYVEGQIPVDIKKFHKNDLEFASQALVIKDIQSFCIRCNKVCSIIFVVGYVFLFLSLILSPYIKAILSTVDLNCITLWSLALLYISLELKTEMCEWLFRLLCKKYIKLLKPHQLVQFLSSIKDVKKE